MSREADIRTSTAVAQFFRNSQRARESAEADPIAGAVSEPEGLHIYVVPPPAGFGPWQQCAYREWASARRDGLPAMQLEVTNDDQFGSAYWIAHRQAGA